MNNSINQFRNNIQYVKNLDGLYQVLKNSTTSALDISDILRSELVLAVSSLDHFVHNTVEEGILEIFQGTRTSTNSFHDFHVSMSNVQYALKNPANNVWLKDQIHKNIGYQSFQKSDKISTILKLITVKKIWDEVAIIMNIDKNHIKLQLDLIINRRNKISHEADLDPTYPNKRWSIDEIMVNTSIQHIENVCESIFQVVK